MQQNLTLWQRLCSATPSFFKKTQLLGLSITALGTSLTQVQGIPAKLTTALISAGTTLAVISQFAVKQYQTFKSPQHENKHKRAKADQTV
jgi:hypothetical protein